MHIIEDYAIFKAREAAINAMACSALALVKEDLDRCDALLSEIDEIKK